MRGFAVFFLALSATACAARGGVPRPFPGAPLPPGASESAPAEEGASAKVNEPSPASTDIVETALKLRGVPYRNGGSDPSGFDCSGFVQYVFAQLGMWLPREVRDQFDMGRKIDLDELHAGDLVFFQTVSSGASHVGLVVDGDQFVHAPSSTGVVRVERLRSPYWSKRYVGARRVQ
jgi:cell wall-associated NlpC family hydrolase